MTSLTLKTHRVSDPPVGFIRQELKIPYIRYDDVLSDVINNLNQYRVGSAVITKLYNVYGQEIPVTSWPRLRIREHLVLYVDRKPQDTVSGAGAGAGAGAGTSK